MSTSIDDAMFGRVVTAMITPFDIAGRVDYDAAVRVAEYLVANGSDGLVISGTTGESPTLTHDEKIKLFTTIKQAIGTRAKILAGTGSYNTDETVELSHGAARAGVDGLLVVAPYYNKPSQEGLYQHFTAVAKATNLPVILYNVPTRTITNIEASTTIRLSAHPTIVGIKEASMNMAQIGEIAYGAPKGFQIYCGADEVNLPMISLGSVGTISVISHLVGNDLQKMYAAYDAGDLVTARDIHLKTLSLTKAMFSVPSPTPTKTALAMLDVIAGATVRLPLVEASDSERTVIQAALKDYGLLK